MWSWSKFWAISYRHAWWRHFWEVFSKGNVLSIAALKIIPKLWTWKQETFVSWSFCRLGIQKQLSWVVLSHSCLLCILILITFFLPFFNDGKNGMTGLEKGRRGERESKKWAVSKKRLCSMTVVQWSGHSPYSTKGMCLLKDTTNTCCPCPWKGGDLTSKRALKCLWPHPSLPSSLRSRGGGTHRQGNGFHSLQTAPWRPEPLSW